MTVDAEVLEGQRVQVLVNLLLPVTCYIEVFIISSWRMVTLLFSYFSSLCLTHYMRTGSNPGRGMSDAGQT